MERQAAEEGWRPEGLDIAGAGQCCSGGAGHAAGGRWASRTRGLRGATAAGHPPTARGAQPPLPFAEMTAAVQSSAGFHAA